MTAIKKFRELRGMTQSELAEKVNISTVTLSRYENGGRDPRGADLSKMAEALSCTVDDLLRGDPANPTPPQPQGAKTE